MDEQFKEYECMEVFFYIDNMSMPLLQIPLAEATEERINAEICAQMARLPK